MDKATSERLAGMRAAIMRAIERSERPKDVKGVDGLLDLARAGELPERVVLPLELMRSHLEQLAELKADADKLRKDAVETWGTVTGEAGHCEDLVDLAEGQTEADTLASLAKRRLDLLEKAGARILDGSAAS